MKPALRFWASAAGVSIGFAALVPVLFPYRLLGLEPAVDRDRVWLLCVFTFGVLLVLFGMAALGGGFRRIGVQDVAEAGGIRQAIERMRMDRTDPDRGYARNFAVWCVATGALLVLIYFALWSVLA